MNAKERDEHEIQCPRCGSEAERSFLDPEKKRIEILCSDCGRYVMTREQFDHAQAESAGLYERELLE